MFILTGFAAALVASSAPADPQSTRPKGEKEAKVCRNLVAPTGSRFGRSRVCKTQAEWDSERDGVARHHDALKDREQY